MKDVVRRSERLQESLDDRAPMSRECATEKGKGRGRGGAIRTAECGSDALERCVPRQLVPGAVILLHHRRADAVRMVHRLRRGLAARAEPAPAHRLFGIAFDFDEPPVDFANFDAASRVAFEASRPRPNLLTGDEGLFRDQNRDELGRIGGTCVESEPGGRGKDAALEKFASIHRPTCGRERSPPKPVPARGTRYTIPSRGPGGGPPSCFVRYPSGTSRS